MFTFLWTQITEAEAISICVTGIYIIGYVDRRQVVLPKIQFSLRKPNVHGVQCTCIVFASETVWLFS